MKFNINSILVLTALTYAETSAQNTTRSPPPESVFGSLEAAQGATESFLFFLKSPGNCLEVISDMPPEAPSKNLAALWIRAAFHDVGNFDPNNQTFPGGGDASLMGFLDVPDNAGLEPSMAPRFMQKPRVNMSQADMIALAGLVSVTHCGGPSIPFRPGRIDALPVRRTSPVGRLPEATEPYSSIKQKLRRMGFSNEDIVSLVTGSHTMGGVHGKNSPKITNKTFVPFDDTPGVFDNNVFKKVLAGQCALSVDCDIAKDPELRPLVELYARDQDAFFKQYSISFDRMLNKTTSNLYPARPIFVEIHKYLLQEGTLNSTSPAQTLDAANNKKSTNSGILGTTRSVIISTCVAVITGALLFVSS